jgi:hypothetical protein
MCNNTGKTVVAPTSKGARVCRVWLQGLDSLGWTGGTRYNVAFDSGVVTLTRHIEGKRKVTASKGGVIDLESKKVAATFAHTDSVTYTVTDSTITIRG